MNSHNYPFKMASRLVVINRASTVSLRPDSVFPNRCQTMSICCCCCCCCCRCFCQHQSNQTISKCTKLTNSRNQNNHSFGDIVFVQKIYCPRSNIAINCSNPSIVERTAFSSELFYIGKLKHNIKWRVLTKFIDKNVLTNLTVKLILLTEAHWNICFQNEYRSK